MLGYLALIGLLLIKGCSCSTDDRGADQDSGAEPRQVRGTVAKGLVQNAVVNFIEIDGDGLPRRDASGAFLAFRTRTDDNGTFATTLPANINAEHFLVLVTADASLDSRIKCDWLPQCQVDGQLIDFGASYPAPADFELRAAVANLVDGSSVHITPYTHMAAAYAESLTANAAGEAGVFSELSIDIANTQIANLFNLPSLLTTRPLDLTDLAGLEQLDALEAQQRLQYSLMSGAIEGLVSVSGDSLDQVLTRLTDSITRERNTDSDPSASRIRGQLFYRGSPADEITLEAIYLQALALAEAQQARQSVSGLGTVLLSFRGTLLEIQAQALNTLTQARPDANLDLSGLDAARAFIEEVLTWEEVFLNNSGQGDSFNQAAEDFEARFQQVKTLYGEEVSLLFQALLDSFQYSLAFLAGSADPADPIAAADVRFLDPAANAIAIDGGLANGVQIEQLAFDYNASSIDPDNIETLRSNIFEAVFSGRFSLTNDVGSVVLDIPAGQDFEGNLVESSAVALVYPREEDLLVGANCEPSAFFIRLPIAQVRQDTPIDNRLLFFSGGIEISFTGVEANNLDLRALADDVDCAGLDVRYNIGSITLRGELTESRADDLNAVLNEVSLQFLSDALNDTLYVPVEKFQTDRDLLGNSKGLSEGDASVTDLVRFSRVTEQELQVSLLNEKDFISALNDTQQYQQLRYRQVTGSAGEPRIERCFVPIGVDPQQDDSQFVCRTIDIESSFLADLDQLTQEQQGFLALPFINVLQDGLYQVDYQGDSTPVSQLAVGASRDYPGLLGVPLVYNFQFSLGSLFDLTTNQEGNLPEAFVILLGESVAFNETGNVEVQLHYDSEITEGADDALQNLIGNQLQSGLTDFLTRVGRQRLTLSYANSSGGETTTVTAVQGDNELQVNSPDNSNNLGSLSHQGIVYGTLTYEGRDANNENGIYIINYVDGTARSLN